MAAAPQAKSDTAARARRDRRRQRMMPGNGVDRSVGRGWVTQYPSVSKRPPRAKVQPHPPDANVTVLFPPHDGARPRAADLLAKWFGRGCARFLKALSGAGNSRHGGRNHGCRPPDGSFPELRSTGDRNPHERGNSPRAAKRAQAYLKGCPASFPHSLAGRLLAPLKQVHGVIFTPSEADLHSLDRAHAGGAGNAGAAP